MEREGFSGKKRIDLGNENVLQSILCDLTRFTSRIFHLEKSFRSDFYQVNNVRRPGDFETAVKDKEAAKENIKVMKHYFECEERITDSDHRLRKMNDRNY